MNFLMGLLLGTTLAMALAGAALAAAEPSVGEIDVRVDLSAADNANALEFWPDLETDLEARLATSLAPLIADDGGRLVVNVKDVSVDGNALLVGGGEFNTLSADITLYPADVPEGSTPQTAMAGVSVRAVPALPSEAVAAEGPVLILAPTDGSVYAAMLDKFAEVVADRVASM